MFAPIRVHFEIKIATILVSVSEYRNGQLEEDMLLVPWSLVNKTTRTRQ